MDHDELIEQLSELIADEVEIEFHQDGYHDERGYFGERITAELVWVKVRRRHDPLPGELVNELQEDPGLMPSIKLRRGGGEVAIKARLTICLFARTTSLWRVKIIEFNH